MKVPGFKANTGTRKFVTFPDGDFTLFLEKAPTITPDKNDPLTDVWQFRFTVEAGPPVDGKPAKGQVYSEFVRIVQEQSVNFKPEWANPDSGKTQMGVDQIKSMAIAMGVKGRGDDLNPESFAGLRAKTHIIQTKAKTGDKVYNRGTDWRPADAE